MKNEIANVLALSFKHIYTNQEKKMYTKRDFQNNVGLHSMIGKDPKRAFGSHMLSPFTYENAKKKKKALTWRQCFRISHLLLNHLSCMYCFPAK